MRAEAAPTGGRPERKLRIRAHSRHPPGTTLGTQDAQPGEGRRAAVGEGAVVGVFGRVGETLRLFRPALGRGDHPADHGDQGVPLERPVMLQPMEPALRGRDAAAQVGGESATLDELCHPVDVARLLGVADGGLQLPVRLTPFGCTSEQRMFEIRLGSGQVRTQHLLEKVVIAVPLPVGVQRYHEQVGARERLQNLRRPALLEDRVAERPGHPLENGGTCEETNIVRGQVGEQLRPEVVGHEPVAPRERRRALGPESPRPDRQRGEVEACGPALCVLGELGDLVVRQVQSPGAQQSARLGFVHAEIVRPDLQRQAPRPQRCQRERRPASRREGHL